MNFFAWRHEHTETWERAKEAAGDIEAWKKDETVSEWSKEKLKDYNTSEHAIQFTLDKTLPSRLVEELVRVHMREIDANRQ